MQSNQKVIWQLERYTTLFQQDYIAIAVCRGPLYVVEAANALICQLWGRPPSDVINKPLFEILPELLGQGFEELLNHVLTTGEPYVGNELPANLMKNGRAETAIFDFIYVPMFKADGSITGVSILATDATARVLARKDAEIEKQRLREVFEQAPALVAVVRGPQHIYELANPLYLQAVAGQKDIIGRCVAEVIPSAAEQGLITILDNVFHTGEPFTGNELRFLRNNALNNSLVDGYFNFVCQPLRNVHGNVDGIFIHAVDVTAQVQSQTALKKSQEQLALAMEASQIGLWDWDIITQELVWSPKLQELYGLSEGTFAGTYAQYQSLIHPDDVVRVNAVVAQALDQKNTYQVEHRTIWPDGTVHWLLGMGKAFYDQNIAVRMSGTCINIDHRKYLEHRKDDFLAIASHEFKTPVTSLKVYAQTLKREFASKGDLQSAEKFAKMDVQLDKLNGLVDDLLDVTKLEKGELVFSTDSFDYDELVHETIEVMQRTTLRHEISIEGRSARHLQGDRNRVAQILSNLIGNAIKYSPSSTAIVITVASNDTGIMTSVKDYGVGIAKENYDKLFERFYRVSGSGKGSYPGLGLGLYICAEIIAGMNGRIRVSSELGKGSEFSFTLPLNLHVATNGTYDNPK